MTTLCMALSCLVKSCQRESRAAHASVAPVSYLEDLTHETLRVYQRYAIEVVERFNFCPWARAAREARKVALHLVFSDNPDDFSESLQLIDQLASPPEPALHESAASRESAEIALFIYPLLDLDRLRFEDFVRRLRSAYEARLPQGQSEFAMAAFHPHAAPDFGHADRLVPYLRRSPDPTLQLLRNSVLSGIKGLSGGTAFLDVEALGISASWQRLHEPPAPPIRERIAEQNLTTAREVGSEALDVIFDDLLADRERAHAGLAARYGRRGPKREPPPQR